MRIVLKGILESRWRKPLAIIKKKNMKSKKPDGMTEINGYVPKELKIEFKKQCVAIDRTMGDVLAELMRDWLEKQKEQ
jgi:hypothetical protein